MLVRLVNLLSALLSPILGKLFSFLEPYRHRRWHHVSPPARLCDPAAARVAPSASGPRHTRWGIER